MKKILSRVIVFSFAVLMLISTVSAASSGVRSSYYLDSYRAWLTPVSGAKINVNVDVQAVDYMDDVGATKIEIYESDDGGVTWENTRIYLSALEDNMLNQDTVIYYDTAVTHQGTEGYKYYAVVTVYAGDSTGYDTREYQTTTVTARS